MIAKVSIEIEKDMSSSQQNTLFGVIDRPTGTGINPFNDITNDISERVRHENNLCYLLDYNNDLSKSGPHKPT